MNNKNFKEWNDINENININVGDKVQLISPNELQDKINRGILNRTEYDYEDRADKLGNKVYTISNIIFIPSNGNTDNTMYQFKGFDN